LRTHARHSERHNPSLLNEPTQPAASEALPPQRERPTVASAFSPPPSAFRRSAASHPHEQLLQQRSEGRVRDLAADVMVGSIVLYLLQQIESLTN
jgi:hypothetical protein